MKKTYLVVGVVGIVVVVSWYLAHPKNGIPVAENQVVESQTLVANEAVPLIGNSGTGRLADMFTQTEPVQCAFTSIETEDSVSEGMFWYDDGLFAAEVLTRAEGELYTSNLINTGTQLYVWSGTAAGMMAIVMAAPTSTEALLATQADAATSDGIDYEQQVSYDCQPWTPNQLQFTPPADMAFIDVAAMMQGMMEGSVPGAPEGLDF